MRQLLYVIQCGDINLYAFLVFSEDVFKNNSAINPNPNPKSEAEQHNALEVRNLSIRISEDYRFVLRKRKKRKV